MPEVPLVPTSKHSTCIQGHRSVSQECLLFATTRETRDREMWKSVSKIVMFVFRSTKFLLFQTKIDSSRVSWVENAVRVLVTKAVSQQNKSSVLKCSFRLSSQG